MKKRVFSIMLAVVLVVSGLVGCGNKEGITTTSDNPTTSKDSGNGEASESGEKVVIRVANFSYVSWNVAFNVAYQEGFFDEIFADDNVELEVTYFGTGPEVNEAFLAGQVDAVWGIGDQPIISALQGKNLQVAVVSTATILPTMGIIVANDSDITDVAQLEGKTIAVGIGTSAQKALLGILEDAGIASNAVEYVNIGGDSAEAALASGEVDAIFTSGYQFATAEEREIGRIIADAQNHPMYSYLEFSQDFLNQHEDLVIKFLEGIKRGEEFFRENPEQGNQDLADLLGLDLEQVKVTTAGVDYTVGLTDAAIENLYLTNEFLYSQGLIDEKVDDAVIAEHVSDIIKKIE